MVVVDVLRRNNVTVTGAPHEPPVVPAHDFGCAQNMWRLVVPTRVTESYRVVLFDNVGSERSDLSAFP